MGIRRVSDDGLEKITQREGERLVAYRDSVGIWTVGVGHISDTYFKVGPGTKITREKSRELLIYDLNEVEELMAKVIKVELNQNQFDALASLIFNIGNGAFRSSTLLKVLNAKQFDKVPAEIMKWNKGTINGKKVVIPGLNSRRASEVGQWNKGAFVASRDVKPIEVKESILKTLAAPENIAQGTGVVVAVAGAASSSSAVGYAVAFAIIAVVIFVGYKLYKRDKKDANVV